MSGPKCNQYVIIDEARLEEIRREQERKLEEERRKRREKLEKERRERLAREKAERENQQFTDIFSEIESSEREFLAKKEEFDLAYGDYCAVCELSGSIPLTVTFDADKAEQLIASLSKMTQKAEEAALEDAKNRYIAESIDQFMVDSGFEPVYTMGSKSTMTVYDFGDDTGVSVINSVSSVSFEVTGLSDTGRAPDADEKKKITDKMGDFCKVFDSLEAKLREKGIGTENVYRMPADEKFARMIIVPRKKARIQINNEENKTASAERKIHNGK